MDHLILNLDDWGHGHLKSNLDGRQNHLDLKLDGRQNHLDPILPIAVTAPAVITAAMVAIVAAVATATL